VSLENARNALTPRGSGYRPAGAFKVDLDAISAALPETRKVQGPESTLRGSRAPTSRCSTRRTTYARSSAMCCVIRLRSGRL
jgi:hypothetical protein